MKKFGALAMLFGFIISGSISIGGKTITPPVNTAPSRGISSVESPDLAMAGDSSGISISSFGLDIDTSANVGQIVTTN